MSQDARTGLSASERELLTLLAAGLTDEVAGRRLGISARSVRRQTAALMERLGASSRFEAGLKAAQHGWLDRAAGRRAVSRGATRWWS